MKKFNNLKYVLVGVVLGSLLFSGAVFAATKYELSFFNAKIIFNGEEKQGSNQENMYWNGQYHVPTALNYMGTTYVPLRFFSEASGLPVKWEGGTKSIYIGDVPKDGEVWRDMLSVITPFYKNSEAGYRVNETMIMGGNEYNRGMQLYGLGTESTYSFNLASKYKSIKGVVGLDDSSNQKGATIEFYADGELAASYDLPAGSLPQNFEIDVEGIVKLDIRFIKKGYSFDSIEVNLADIMIK